MWLLVNLSVFFFLNDTATTEIYTLSLHDAISICRRPRTAPQSIRGLRRDVIAPARHRAVSAGHQLAAGDAAPGLTHRGLRAWRDHRGSRWRAAALHGW